MDFWSAPWGDLLNFEIVGTSKMSDDVWELPTSEASGGALRNRYARVVDFRKALPPDWDAADDKSVLVVRRLKRAAALMRLVTLKFDRRTVRPPKPSTWVLNCHALLRAAGRSLSMPRERLSSISACPDGPSLFAHLTEAQIRTIASEEATFASAVIPRLNAFKRAGKIDDWPAGDVASSRLGGEQWQPFSDKFTAEIATAALWFMRTFGADLVQCHIELASMTTLPSGSRRRDDLNEWRKGRLAEWSGERLTPGLPFPYEISLTNSGDNVEVLSAWPPRLPVQVRQLLVRLQGAHAIVVFLAAGMRDGELAELARQCLDELGDAGDIIGHTFKLADDPRGELRRWPLPKVAVEAIRQQSHAAAALDPQGKALWVPFSPRRQGDGLSSLRSHVTAFCESVRKNGVPLVEMCDGSLHTHRFRKTVARLTALSLHGACQVLFDLFGHRDPEMTLSYIMSDPDLQEDIRKISYEAAVALGREAVSGSDRNGGPAAASVRMLAGRLVPRLADDELDVAGVGKAAEILAIGGALSLVRPGVLCTKAFNQFGPCSRSAGNPDIGACQTDCTHRLELAAGRADTTGAIEQILSEMPMQRGLLRTWWQGQLNAHLAAFADIKANYVLDPRVQAALAPEHAE